jgi:hypothetical protein
MHMTNLNWRLALPILFLLLQGCTTAVLVGGLAVEPFFRRTGNMCIDSPAQAYALKYSACDPTISPIRPWNVNSQWRSSNGYCFLEWALVYDRMDIVQEAISKGADPFKCQTNGFPLFTAMSQVEATYGRERLQTYKELLKTSRAISRASSAKIVRAGITRESLDLIRYGLELGHPIDAPMFVEYDYGRFRDTDTGKTPLYVASRLLLQSPSRRGEDVVRLLIQQGAQIDPEIHTHIASNRSNLKPEGIVTLEALLKPLERGAL